MKSDSADAEPRSQTNPMKNFGGALGDDDLFGDDSDYDDDDEDYEDSDDEDLFGDDKDTKKANNLLDELRAGNVGPVVVTGSSTTSAPSSKSSTTEANDFNVNFDSEDDDEDDYEDDEDYFEDEASSKAPVKETKPLLGKDDLPLWRLYLAGDLVGSEHEYDKERQLFDEVMTSWRADFSSRENQLKKDWEEAKTNVKQTAGDQSALNQVSEEFRRSFTSLKDQGISEHVRLLDVHDQRIQSRLVQRQKTATKKLSEVIQNSPADPEEVADYLEDLIDIQEKQKKHATNYFSKLRNIQPSSADKVLGDLKARIRRIEDQLAQSMELLKKLPERDFNKIKPEITAYLKTYQDVEDAATLMMRLMPNQKIEQKQLEQLKDSSEEEDDDDYDSLDFIEDDEDEDDDFGVDENDDEEEEGAGLDLNAMEFNNKIKAEMSALRQEENTNFTSPANASLSTVLVIGSALAAAFLLVIVVGLVVYRGMSRRKYAGRMLVTTAVSPEERHVNNMQSNGYENPTYKYFYEVNA